MESIICFIYFDFVELHFPDKSGQAVPVLRLPLTLKGAKNRLRVVQELGAAKINYSL
jgi:hypothetical protein